MRKQDWHYVAKVQQITSTDWADGESLVHRPKKKVRMLKSAGGRAAVKDLFIGPREGGRWNWEKCSMRGNSGRRGQMIMDQKKKSINFGNVGAQ